MVFRSCVIDSILDVLSTVSDWGLSIHIKTGILCTAIDDTIPIWGKLMPSCIIVIFRTNLNQILIFVSTKGLQINIFYIMNKFSTRLSSYKSVTGGRNCQKENPITNRVNEMSKID